MKVTTRNPRFVQTTYSFRIYDMPYQEVHRVKGEQLFLEGRYIGDITTEYYNWYCDRTLTPINVAVHLAPSGFEGDTRWGDDNHWNTKGYPYYDREKECRGSNEKFFPVFPSQLVNWATSNVEPVLGKIKALKDKLCNPSTIQDQWRLKQIRDALNSYDGITQEASQKNHDSWSQACRKVKKDAKQWAKEEVIFGLQKP